MYKPFARRSFSSAIVRITLASIVPLCGSVWPAHANELQGLMFKEGHVVKMVSGSSTGRITEETTLADGTRVMPDGTVVFTDGKKKRMQEGQLIGLDGKMAGVGDLRSTTRMDGENQKIRNDSRGGAMPNE